MKRASPRVFVVSAPSGTGKTTLNRRLIGDFPGHVAMSISYTARPIRAGETNGIDYHFVTVDEFKARIARGEMLEWAEVFGKFYGTSLEEVRRIHALGRTCLLEIDVQGWRQAKVKLEGAKSVFILPPSIEELWKRLEARGTETLAVRWRRLRTAREEIAAGHLYDHFILNDSVESAYSELKAIIINGESGKVPNQQGHAQLDKLLAEFDAAPWIRKLSEQFADK